MTPDRLAHFKSKLQDLAQELKADLNQNADDAKVVDVDTSIGRLSRMDAMQSQQMALELRRRQQNALLRAENSLQRIEKGTYGICGRCKQPIPESRLDARPDTAFCVQCADQR